MSGDFISRSKATAIRRALAKMIMAHVETQLNDPEFAEATFAAAQTGGSAAVSAVLEAKRDDLDKSVERLVAAAIAEIDADED
jgi:hypothetical protein